MAKWKKDGLMNHWRALPANLPILPHMTPIPYKSEGSTFGACGIRIDGNPAFVDAVLSRVKDLLAGENQIYRLGLSRTEVKGDFKPAHNRAANAEVCYIRLHERGGEAIMANGIMASPAQRAATLDFAKALGVNLD